MTIYGAQIGAACGSSTTSNCPDKYGCGSTCPDFIIKRHDTVPPFKVSVEDCDGPLDLSDESIVVEVNIWANAKLKRALTEDDDYFALADGIGFDQVLAGDIIVIDRARLPEHMLVLGFDETNKLIQVQRGYHGTGTYDYPKGTGLKIFKEINAVGAVEFNREDILNVDGTTTDQLLQTFLVYNWAANDTCLPGCYMLEFKVLKVAIQVLTALDTSIVPSFTPSIADFGCETVGAEWVRRFPVNNSGFVIQIIDSPTAG